MLAGWAFDIHALKTIYGPITMKANTAACLVLCGLSLVVVRWWPRASRAGGVAAAMVGALTMIEHLSGFDIGIDQLIFVEAAGAAATASPNRMGPNACITFMLMGTALVYLAGGRLRGVTVAQRLAALALVPASIALTGYVYGAEQLYGVAHYTGIALHTALAFEALAVGILLARPDVGFTAVLLDEGPAGTMLRRLAVPSDCVADMVPPLRSATMWRTRSPYGISRRQRRMCAGRQPPCSSAWERMRAKPQLLAGADDTTCTDADDPTGRPAAARRPGPGGRRARCSGSGPSMGPPITSTRRSRSRGT